MEPIRLDNIPFRVDLDQLLQNMRVKPGGREAARIAQLAAEAESIARPKALYRVAYIEARGDDCLVIDGVKLTSRVLQVNLEHAQRVFPFVATCGREMENWSAGLSDMLEGYWAGAIMEMALRAAVRTLAADLTERFRPGHTSTMNPGSLADWPLSEQRPLFALLGDPYRSIGVELTDSFLMVPIKSVSGLRFPTEVTYENCQLCSREGCPGRRAPYEPDLYESKYRAPPA